MSMRHDLLNALRRRLRIRTRLRGLDHRFQERIANRRSGDVGMHDIRRLLPDFEATLSDNIIDFWLPRCLDHEHGGYLVDFDAEGRFCDLERKGLIAQARMLWLFSRLVSGGFETARNPRSTLLAAAESGFQFLRQRLWDPVNGGFFWDVDRAGVVVKRDHKDMCGQAFGLFAMSQYFLASGDESARRTADELFQLLEGRMHDNQYGGYFEFLNREWGAPSADVFRYTGRYPHGAKTMNAHLHLLEALTPYYRAAQSVLVRDRLIELIQIQTTAVMRSDCASSYDCFERNWQPSNGGWNRHVSFGHDLENIHIVSDACDSVCIPGAPYLPLFGRVASQALRDGFDWKNGGFYLNGEVGKPASGRDKVWWVQAEAMLSLLWLHQRLHSPRALNAFLQTWTFAERELIDRRVGEWFEAVRPDGTVTRGKGHEWKTGYHNGRALIRCIEVLRSS